MCQVTREGSQAQNTKKGSQYMRRLRPHSPVQPTFAKQRQECSARVDCAFRKWKARHHPNAGKAIISIRNYNARGHYNEKLIPNLDLQRPCHDYNAGNLSCNAQVSVKIPGSCVIKPEITTAMPNATMIIPSFCQETRTPATFFLISLTMDTSLFFYPSLHFPYVLPNRSHSPPLPSCSSWPVL